jgi:hypothetical protein
MQVLRGFLPPQPDALLLSSDSLHALEVLRSEAERDINNVGTRDPETIRQALIAIVGALIEIGSKPR